MMFPGYFYAGKKVNILTDFARVELTYCDIQRCHVENLVMYYSSQSSLSVYRDGWV